jgi:hypothetical protein
MLFDIDFIQTWLNYILLKENYHIDLGVNTFHSFITLPNYIKSLAVFLEPQLRFHTHVKYIFSRCIMLLRLVAYVTFSLSSIEYMYILCFNLVRSKI